MTRLRLFYLKNVMFTANLAATAVGAGLLYIIYEFVLRNHRTDQYVEFHIRTSNYLGVIFTLFFACIIVYEWPIRRYLGKMCAKASIPANLQSIVEKRLLNEPYVINDMTEGLMERDRMRQSLDLAMEVQQNLLPKGNLKKEETWDL